MSRTMLGNEVVFWPEVHLTFHDFFCLLLSSPKILLLKFKEESMLFLMNVSILSRADVQPDFFADEFRLFLDTQKTAN